MTANATAGTISVRKLFSGLAGQWPLLLGLAFMAIPTIASLARQTWASDLGAHGPIVLATGLWLISRAWPKMQEGRTHPSGFLLVAGYGVALAAYIFGRAYDFISIETFGLYLAGAMTVYSLVGWGGVRVALFPLIYLAFIVPLPGWVLDQITSPLRMFVSYVATEGLRWLGYPIIREGVAIYIAQYQLLVEDACSGMNSIVGLTAIALFYVHVMGRERGRYVPFLLLMIIPIAIVVNLLRVVILILLTYYAGDGVAQGFMHMTTGIVLFVVALFLMFALDMVLRFLFGGRGETDDG
ncbi:MAG: exosortase V [Sphingobium sp.]